MLLVFDPIQNRLVRHTKEIQIAPFRTAIFSGIVIVAGFTLASLAFADGAKSGTADAEFMKMDTSKDGKVTAAEMEAAHKRVTGRKAAKSDMSAPDKIKVIDTDGDGVLTAEEHASGSRAIFEKMDTDKDSFLTKDEVAAGHASMIKKPSR